MSKDLLAGAHEARAKLIMNAIKMGDQIRFQYGHSEAMGMVVGWHTNFASQNGELRPIYSVLVDAKTHGNNIQVPLSAVVAKCRHDIDEVVF